MDAIVIIGAFVIELAITDPMDQAGSLIIVIRLWRVFKVVGELSSEAEGEITALRKQIEKLKHKNEEILKENHDLRLRVQAASSGSASVTMTIRTTGIAEPPSAGHAPESPGADRKEQHNIGRRSSIQV